jgi:tetratricopeptide (TPR) repeat protein
MINAWRKEGRTLSSAAAWMLVSLFAVCSVACSPHAAPDLAPSHRLADMKALPAESRPKPNTAAQNLESWDPLLAAALADLARNPTAETHREVANQYRRLHVLDSADKEYRAALALDPHDAAAYDGRARVSRDSGFPALGLGDAYRAVHFAPLSAVAVNTLGTVFEALGRLTDARAQYLRAAQLDPAASYPVMNLCHIDTRLGRRDAVASCVHALNLEPGSAVAHNNLALAYAVAGDFPGAQVEFSAAGGGAATAAYNMGVVYMAARQFEHATSAFQAARDADPLFPLAGKRLKQLGAMKPQ